MSEFYQIYDKSGGLHVINLDHVIRMRSIGKEEWSIVTTDKNFIVVSAHIANAICNHKTKLDKIVELLESINGT